MQYHWQNHIFILKVAYARYINQKVFVFFLLSQAKCIDCDHTHSASPNKFANRIMLIGFSSLKDDCFGALCIVQSQINLVNS